MIVTLVLLAYLFFGAFVASEDERSKAAEASKVEQKVVEAVIIRTASRCHEACESWENKEAPCNQRFHVSFDVVKPKLKERLFIVHDEEIFQSAIENRNQHWCLRVLVAPEPKKSKGQKIAEVLFGPVGDTNRHKKDSQAIRTDEPLKIWPRQQGVSCEASEPEEPTEKE